MVGFGLPIDWVTYGARYAGKFTSGNYSAGSTVTLWTLPVVANEVVYVNNLYYLINPAGTTGNIDIYYEIITWEGSLVTRIWRVRIPYNAPIQQAQGSLPVSLIVLPNYIFRCVLYNGTNVTVYVESAASAFYFDIYRV